LQRNLERNKILKTSSKASISQLTHGWPEIVGETSVLMSQGSPRHNKMSKVFDPIELLMPIEPCPWRVTITEETASGTEVPAAKNVSPNTLSV
jgi:hypothetical protein